MARELTVVLTDQEYTALSAEEERGRLVQKLTAVRWLQDGH